MVQFEFEGSTGRHGTVCASGIMGRPWFATGADDQCCNQQNVTNEIRRPRK